MKINENIIFRKLTEEICTSLEIEETLVKSFRYFKKFIPADGLTFDISNNDGSITSIARISQDKADISDKRIKLSTKGRKEEVENINRKDVMIYNAPDLNPISLDFSRQLKIPEASHLVLYLNLGDHIRGGLAIYTFGENIYTQKHADLLQQVKIPFSIAMSNALKFRDIKLKASKFQEENKKLYSKLITSNEVIIGENTGLKEVMTYVHQVAPVDTPVMLLGETGVGKDVIANKIHKVSKRKNHPIIKINCGAIPENLIESELFGHEKGAFTGAIESKAGKFERADKGTLFLDEVGELSTQAQVRLLRAIQFNEIERIGGKKTIKIDVRIISATNKNLEDLVRRGEFREDLFFRLNVFPIQIQPLRARKQDIPEFIKYFINKKTIELKLHKKPELNSEFINELENYHWPGNIRELSNIIERSLILNKSIDLSDSKLLKNVNNRELTVDTEENLLSFEEMSRQYIIKALKKTKGRIQGEKGAAKLLKLHHNTLRSKIKKLNIQIEKYR